MKYKAHVPTEQYGFIEIEADSREEVIHEYNSIKDTYENGGLDVKKWARVRNHFYKTGDIDPADYEALSKAQRYWINESKLAIRNT